MMSSAGALTAYNMISSAGTRTAYHMISSAGTRTAYHMISSAGTRTAYHMKSSAGTRHASSRAQILMCCLWPVENVNLGDISCMKPGTPFLYLAIVTYFYFEV